MTITRVLLLWRKQTLWFKDHYSLEWAGTHPPLYSLFRQ